MAFRSEERAVKHLVTESDGTTHLPYTDASGKPDHNLMGAAWAALHGGYRGKKYAGPNKAQAIKKLKAVYKSEGMDTPEEKADMPADLEARADILRADAVRQFNGPEEPDEDDVMRACRAACYAAMMYGYDMFDVVTSEHYVALRDAFDGCDTAMGFTRRESPMAEKARTFCADVLERSVSVLSGADDPMLKAASEWCDRCARSCRMAPADAENEPDADDVETEPAEMSADTSDVDRNIRTIVFGNQNEGASLDRNMPNGEILAIRDFEFQPARREAGSRTITCRVAPYNSRSKDLGGFVEVYAPGCFDESLARDDQRALFAHDPRFVLGRKSAGTARFWSDANGVNFEADVPDTTWANDLLTSMDRGDISQSSASFFIEQQHVELRDGQKVRVVEKARLVEGSVVSSAAYEATTATARSAGEFEVSDEVRAVEQEQLGARLRLLAIQ